MVEQGVLGRPYSFRPTSKGLLAQVGTGRLAVFVMLTAVSLAVLLVLTLDVRQQLSRLETARSDSQSWTLAQTEVEFLAYQYALRAASEAPKSDLNELRQAFDIFYSRVQTVSRGPIYGALWEDAALQIQLREILAFLERTVPYIDQADADLRENVPQLLADTARMRTTLRRFSLGALGYFADIEQSRREGISQTLVRVALVSLGLLGILILGSVFLARSAQVADRRAYELSLTSERLQTIIGTSLDAIVVMDDKGRVVDFNEAAESIFSYRREDVLGQRVADLIIPYATREAHQKGIQKHVSRGEKTFLGKGLVNMTALDAEGREFPVEMSVQAAQGREGVLFVSFIRDISRRVAAENALVKARDQAVAGEKAKAEFLAVMSHEIRTPLNGLLGSLSLLQETALTEKQVTFAENMAISGRLLMQHVNDVLDVSRYEAGKVKITPGPTDIPALLTEVVAAQSGFARETGNTVTWSWRGTPCPKLITDGPRVRQVCMNLLGNALKFTQLGKIEIVGEILGDGPFPQLAIAVIDTGCGIAPERLATIFDDFETGEFSYSRTASGTGLGLGIARRIVEALRGTIAVDSQLGQGTTFTVKIPVEIAPTQDVSSVPKPLAPTSASSRKVLLIEDNEINRMVLREMLEADGHSVDEAVNGAEGVQKSEQMRFDLILTDISMPVMDGVTAARMIRTGQGASCQTPIVAVTAHAMPVELASFRDAGISDCISKPLDRKKIRKLFSDLGPDKASTEKAARVLDPSIFEEIMAQLGPKRMQDVLNGLDDEIRATTRALMELDAGTLDAEAVADMAHKTSGSAAVIGASGLHHELSDICQCLKSDIGLEDKAAVLEKLAQAQQGLHDAVKNALPPEA